MKTNLLAVAFCSLFAFASCADDTQDLAQPTAESQTTEQSFIHDHDEDGHTDVAATPFEDELIAHAEHASEDYFSAERVEVQRPDGTTDIRYVVGGDIELTKEELGRLQQMDASTLKHYRTYNTVSKQVINVVGYTGGSNGLTPRMQTALRWAVNNWNALNINKTFSLRFASSTAGDIIVYRTGNGVGGQAGFPTYGNPYKWVQIFGGMNNYDTNTVEHVITHEIGHCMGLRHTDYATRASCNQSGEGAGSIGAVYIPGTPTGYYSNSIMQACFGSYEDGEFGPYDRIALEYMY